MNVNRQVYRPAYDPFNSFLSLLATPGGGLQIQSGTPDLSRKSRKPPVVWIDPETLPANHPPNLPVHLTCISSMARANPKPSSPKAKGKIRTLSYTPISDACSQPFTFVDTELSAGM